MIATAATFIHGVGLGIGPDMDGHGYTWQIEEKRILTYALWILDANSVVCLGLPFSTPEDVSDTSREA
jgi:hypothetical protein